MPELEVAVMTRPGPDGSNQDTHYAQEIDNGFIMAVADGMGGPKGGAAASATAASVMEELMEEEFESVKEWVDFAFGETNQRIFAFARLYPELRGMGTTMTVAVLWDEVLHVGHVGDCRLYRFRSGILEQLTTDHTLLNTWNSGKVQNAEKAREQAGLGSLLTRSVGSSEDVYPDYFKADVQRGDIFLLCTDGLHRLVTDREMARFMVGADPGSIVKGLMDLAVKRGLVDDATVVVALVEDPTREDDLDERARELGRSGESS